MAQRQPTVGSDDNTWGGILNNYLLVAHNSAGGSYTLNKITASYNIDTTETGSIGGANAPVANEFFLVDATSASITVTLPDASTDNFKNMLYSIKRIDNTYPTHTVTISASHSQTIDGSSSASIKVQYASVMLMSDGSNWFVI